MIDLTHASASVTQTSTIDPDELIWIGWYHTRDSMHGWPFDDHTVAGGIPAGAMGFYCTVTNGYFDYLEAIPTQFPFDYYGRYDAVIKGGEGLTGEDALEMKKSSKHAFPTLLRGVRASDPEGFEVTFSVKKTTSDTESGIRFYFDAADVFDYNMLHIYAHNTGGEDPVAETTRGGGGFTNTGTGTPPNIAQNDTMWVRVVYDPSGSGSGSVSVKQIEDNVDAPSEGGEDNVETLYYAQHNTHFNVIGIVDDAGALVERYEYTPYGQRQVFTSAGSNDPDSNAPTNISVRHNSGGTTFAILGLPQSHEP